MRGGLGRHAYTAAKHGVVGLTESTAVELAPWGIRVNAVAAGAMVSAINKARRFYEPAAAPAPAPTEQEPPS